MSTEMAIWFKTRITTALDDAIKQLAIELQIERSAAGRELLRRGVGIHVTPVVIHPQWSDKDLLAFNALREPAHRLYQVAKELRSLVEDECGENTELRGKIAEAASQVYAEYIALRDIRDALIGLTVPEVVSIRNSLNHFRKQAADGTPDAATLVKLLERFGF